MIAHPLPAMRIKNRWFKSGDGKDAAQQASAMAFIVWRVAQNMLKRMRGAQYDIDAGPAYFAFMREVLVFLVALTDRIAYLRLTPEQRHEFTVALVRHVARNLQENEDNLLGPPPPGAPSSTDSFIDFVNEITPHYAEFGADPVLVPGEAVFHPDFSFVRYLGFRLEPTLPEKDKFWVIDQVMAIEAPEAIDTIQRSMHELHDATPAEERKPRRSRVSED